MRARAQALAPLLAVSVATAQAPAREIARSDSVVLAIPPSFLLRARKDWVTPISKLDVDVRRAYDGGVEVFSAVDSSWRRDWRLEGFPSARHYAVTAVREATRPGREGKFIEIVLQAGGAAFVQRHRGENLDYSIFVPAVRPSPVTGMLANTKAADSLFRIAYDTLGMHLFTGPLEQFSPADRTSILRFAHLTGDDTRIGAETFKDRSYLVVWLPMEGDTWNDLRVARGERVGRQIEKQLDVLKAMAAVAARRSKIGGLKFQQLSKHGTAPNYVDVTVDKIEAYFPLEALLKFANADITSQELVNLAIVLVNGDRVAVNLSQL